MLLLLSFIPFAPTLAQDSRDAVRDTVVESIEVRVVNVEVVVEDSRQRRVEGLGPQDFRLLIDGRDTPIEYFTEVRDERAIVPPSAPGVRSLPALRPGGSVARNYLVFIDDYFAVGARRNFILKSLHKQLSELTPQDRLAVVRFSGRRLEILSDWTSDRGAMQRVLAEAAARPAFGLVRFTAREDLGISIPSEGGSFFRSELEYELEREANALTSAMRGLGRPAGRKFLLLLSGGWPPLETSVLSRRIFPERAETDLDIFRVVSETANLLGYTIYTVDTAGIRAPGDVLRVASLGSEPAPLPNNLIGESAQAGVMARAILQPFSQSALLDGRPVEPTTTTESLRLSTLRVIARDTGGRAMLGSDRTKALAGARADSRSFYWLGFTPRRERDDALHDIRVEVTNGDYRIRARRGFRDLSPRAEASMSTMRAALLGAAYSDNQLAATLGAPRRVGRGRVEIDVRVEIPTGEIVFLPDTEGFVAQLELRLAAVDPGGGQSEVPVIPVVVRSSAEPTASLRRTISTTMTLRRREQDLAVSLFDRLGGRVFVTTLPVEP